MPFNGAGVFTIINTFVPGTTIFSSAMNANFTDIATGLTTVYGLATNAPVASVNILRRNGGLEIWQRGAGGSASIAIPASNASYTSDGWYIKTGANEDFTVSQQAGLTSGSEFCARVQRDSGQTGTTGMTFGFPIDTDELWPMLGQFVRLSLTLRAGANWSPTSGNITIALNVGTGTPVQFTTGYTGASVAATLTQAISTTAARYQFSAAAIIPTTTRQAEVTLTWTPVGTASTNDYFEIDDVQLEIQPAPTGYVASNFERLNFTEQLLLCQRHFFKTFDYNVAPAQAAGLDKGEYHFGQWITPPGGQYCGSIPLATSMRIVPTCIIYSPATAQAEMYDVTAAAAWTSSQVAANLTSVSCEGLVPLTSAAGNLTAIQITADSGI